MCKNEKYAGATYDDWVQQGRFVPARTAYVIVNGDGTLTLSSKEGMPHRYHPVCLNPTQGRLVVALFGR